ncbi:MAG: UbiA family prenyltransferase [Candidatus Dormibacteria bacterium]
MSRAGTADPLGVEAPARPSPRAVLALLHPGPSLLVTACFVAAVAAARHRPPDLTTGIRLVLVMLPIQFAIGALNDLCDREADRVTKPRKPLASGAVAPRVAVGVTAAGLLLGVATAATFPLPTVALAATGAGAGVAYDLWLQRGLLSWFPYWVAFVALPLCAWATVGHLDRRAALAVPPLALVLALSLHLANAGPDAAADRSSGAAGLAARLGARWSRRLSLWLAAVAAAAAVLAAPVLGQPAGVVLLGAIPLLGAAAVLAALRGARTFPALACGTAILVAVWLLALP